MSELKDKINEAFTLTKNEPGRKRYALMLFETELKLGISNHPNKWVNYANRFYSRGLDALDAYANTQCPASQLVAGTSPEELENEMLEMVEHYKDDKWLEENLYPYM